jgi:hypothetical protein
MNISMTLLMLCAMTTAPPYPVPEPPVDTSAYGLQFQRTMTLMATSTPEHRNTVRILFYGQSIMGQLWHGMVMDDLKNRFPHTYFVVENRAIGGFSSQLLVRTVDYDVIPFYPDLLVFHVFGAHDKYEEFIREVRSRTAAEVIMQSDHATAWPEPRCEGNFWENQPVWEDKMNYFVLPDIAKKYGCAFQPQRWEWVDYLKANKLEPADLLSDTVHLNKQGEWLMSELLKRFLVHLPEEDADYDHLVRTYEVGKDIHWQDNRLVLPFDGNRVVALAGPGPHARAMVAIDGKTPGQHPECYTITRPSGTPGVGSHWPSIKRISWEQPPVLEKWVATCSGFNEEQDDFSFTVEGSVTGPDGEGRGNEKFVSRSGRVVIEPDDWVLAYDKKVEKKSAPEGFQVRWEVQLMGTDVYVAPDVRESTREYVTVLASDLNNGPHTLELVAEDGNRPGIRALRVYQPPIKKGR